MFSSNGTPANVNRKAKNQCKLSPSIVWLHNVTNVSIILVTSDIHQEILHSVERDMGWVLKRTFVLLARRLCVTSIGVPHLDDPKQTPLSQKSQDEAMPH